MEREDRVCLLPGPESELAPLAPHTRSSVELWPGQLSTGLSGLATQDRWLGIISASQSAMAAVVGGGVRGEALTLSPCAYTCTLTNARKHIPFPTPAADTAWPPDIYEVGREIGGEMRFRELVRTVGLGSFVLIPLDSWTSRASE